MDYQSYFASQSAFAGYGLEEIKNIMQLSINNGSQSAFAGYGLEDNSHLGTFIRFKQSQSAFAGYGLEVIKLS